jgi:DNA-binding response OmpR family regulator
MTVFSGLFWEDTFESEIFAKASSKFPIIIYGGRGLGKTYLLSNLRARLQPMKCLFIDGRDKSSARNRLLRIKDIPSSLLIDSIDALVTPDNTEELKIVREVVIKLSGMIPPSNREDRPVFIATSTIDPQGPLQMRLTKALDPGSQQDLLDSYSPFAERLEKFRLDPWAGDWKGRWTEKFSQAFGACLGSDTLEELWCTTILRLTGGHPSLAGPALTLLDGMCQQRNLSLEAPSIRENHLIDHLQLIDETVRVNLGVLVEDHVSRNGLPRVRSALRRLKCSTDALEQRSYRQLVDIATKGAAANVIEVKVRNVLEDEGLVYKDFDANRQYVFRTPGTLISQELHEHPNQVHTDIAITTDPSGEKGELLVRSEGGITTQIPLGGTPWKALRALHAASGEFLSTETLQQRAGLENGRAVQNAIQRLRKELKLNDMEDLVDNEYGLGYRLATKNKIGL